MFTIQIIRWASQLMQPDHQFINVPDDKITMKGRGGPRSTNSGPERIHIHDKEGGFEEDDKDMSYGQL